MVNLLIKKLNEQCPGTGSKWHAEVDGCRQYIFLWATGRTFIKIYPRPFSKMDDNGNITVGVNWFIEPAAYTDEEMQTEEFKLVNSFFKISEM